MVSPSGDQVRPCSETECLAKPSFIGRGVWVLQAQPMALIANTSRNHTIHGEFCTMLGIWLKCQR